MAALRLKIYKMANIHRGEERQTIVFAAIYLMVSMITGLLGSGADVLFLQHETTPVERQFFAWLTSLQSGFTQGSAAVAAVPSSEINALLTSPLLGLGALLLLVLGISYTGWTDRRSKSRVFQTGMAFSLLLSGAAAAGLLFPVIPRLFPFFYSFLYIFRFAGGVLLLMFFWDLTGTYFDVRQGKRLYPLMAMSGVIGYTSGTLLVTPLLIWLPAASLFLLIALLSVISSMVYWLAGGQISPLWIIRGRAQGFREALREGFQFFRRSSFLKALSVSTLIFGIASGFIMFAFNNVVSSLAATPRGTASFIAFQRAIASVLQAVIVTKVLSQSALGGQLKSNFVIQVGVLILGFLAFVVSMVGVADFTRQIATALLSPAAMASFAIIPARFRGRSMAAVNLIVAPAGMVLASLLVFFLDAFFAIGVLLALIAFFLILRLAMNLLVNRAYIDTLTRGVKSRGKFDAASLMEDSETLLQDEKALAVWMKGLAEQDESMQLMVWSRLVKQVKTKADYQHLKPFAPPLVGRRGALWLSLMRRYEAEEALSAVDSLLEGGCLKGLGPLSPEMGKAILNTLKAQKTFRTSEDPVDDLSREMVRRRKALLLHLGAEPAEGEGSQRDQDFLLEKADQLLLSQELEGDDASLKILIRTRWESYSPLARSRLLPLLFENPSLEFQEIFFQELAEPETRPGALSALEKIPRLDGPLWESHFQRYREESALADALLEILGHHMGSELLDWFWDFLSRELTQEPQELFAHFREEASHRDLSALLRIALTIPMETPPRIRTQVQGRIENLITLKAELLSLQGDPFPPDALYGQLYRRWVGGFEKILRQELLYALGLKIRDSDQRYRYSLLIRDYQPEMHSTRARVLEILDVVLDKREQTALSLFLEPITMGEKLLRLRGVIKDPQATWESFFAYWNSGVPLPSGRWTRALLHSSLERR